jgi:streptomycin 6-kinase
MKPLVAIVLLVVFGCGTDKALLMDSKFDASLRQKMSTIGENDPAQNLAVLGKCSTTIDAAMRQDLIDAGADVGTMQGDIFTANVSSENIYKVAALEFVTQVQLSKESKLFPK